MISLRPIWLCVSRAPRTVALLSPLACALSASAQPTFSLVGNPGSRVVAISADGSTLVGYEPLAGNITHPFKWNSAAPGVGVDLGMFSATQSGRATAVSSNGSLIVGTGTVAFRWRPSTGLSPMSAGALPYGVSTDGSAIVGRSSFGVAGVWTDILGTAATPPTLLPVVGSNSFNDAVAISSDQTIVAGNAIDAGGECSLGAFWAVGSGQLLPGIQSVNSKAVRAMTPDGRFIVGSIGQCDFFGGAGQAARWDNGIPRGLGALPGHLGSIANAISADGSVVVGHHYTQPYQSLDGTQAFIWTSSTGLLDLRSFLLSVGIQSGDLRSATGISADGSIIVGNGFFTTASQGWMVRLDPAVFGVRLLSPPNGAVALAPPLSLSWSAAPEATSYDVTLTIDSGAPILLSTTNTSIPAPAAATAECRTVTWGVIAHTPAGTLVSYPPTRTFSTLRIGDFDRNGTVTVADIFSFISAWFSGNPAADINGNGLAVSDLFDFLARWFTGCP